ncbi:MAG TPA: YihY/virulence factor BrkB family protein [Burkholderiaceae bacterium]|nr:YihY/virulence factor BrkB family protein [Burkholderiaceae bacterium]
MKPAKRASKWEILWSVAQLLVLTYSAWSELRQHRSAAPARDAVLPQQPPRALVPASAVPAAPAAALSKRPAARRPSRSKMAYLRNIGAVAVDAGRAWAARRAASKGAALALYTLFSLAPMLVLVVAMAGIFFGEETVRQLLVEQMKSLMGAQGADAIRAILQGTQHKDASLMASLVSAALILVSATTAFAELKDSLDELWEVPKSASSGIWGLLRERFLSFGLILVLALMLLASLAVSTALAALSRLWGGGGADSVFEIITRGVTSAVSFLIVAALFAVIFKYLPATRIAWRDVIVGAFITAALFSVGKALITLYVARSNISSSYGAAGSVVVLITWIYYSAQIFFYGSLFTYEYAFQLGSRAHGRASGAGASRKPESRVR